MPFIYLGELIIEAFPFGTDPAVFQFRSPEFDVSESVLNAIIVIENVGNTAESGTLR